MTKTTICFGLHMAEFDLQGEECQPDSATAISLAIYLQISALHLLQMMYESKIFVQCVIQSGADSTAPEWEEDGQLTSPGPTFLQEASKPQPCMRSVDVPLLRSLPQRQLLTNIAGL